MAENKDIICISMTTWEGDYMKAVVHMMGHLAKNHRVLFVDYAFTFKDLLFGLLGKPNIPINRMLGIEPRLRQIRYNGNELHHLTLPPALPLNWIKNEYVYDFLMNIQTKILNIPHLINALNKLNFTKTILINAFNPVCGMSLKNRLPVTHTIYYCYDEISASGWGSHHGKRLEQIFARHVDQIIVSSTALLASKSQLNNNTYIIKNGVDFELFHKAYTTKKLSESPQIGYIGSIDSRLDFDLLIQTVQNLPDCDFTFVGRITDYESQIKLENFSNVVFKGPQQPEQLPKFISNMHVAIIPFAKNEFTRNIYPLKINEYLAAGLQVVSTDFADLTDFKQVISITKNTADFIHAIKSSLENPNIKQTQKKIAMAKSNDWSGRVDQFNKVLSLFKASHV